MLKDHGAQRAILLRTGVSPWDSALLFSLLIAAVIVVVVVVVRWSPKLPWSQCYYGAMMVKYGIQW